MAIHPSNKRCSLFGSKHTNLLRKVQAPYISKSHKDSDITERFGSLQGRFYVPKGYWDHNVHTREFFDWLAEQVLVDRTEDWYSLGKDDVKERGGVPLCERYDGSPSRMLEFAYPDTAWQFWKFETAPRYRWDPAQQREFFDWLGDQLHVVSYKDWYKVSRTDISSRAGGALMALHGYSHMKALCNVYPEVEWHPWLFETVPTCYWEVMDHQERYFMWFAEELKLENVNSWYKIKQSHVLQHGGSGLLATKYGNSVVKALQSVFPEVEWIPWKFEKSPRKFWSQESHQKQYLRWFEDLMGIKSPRDWYKITYRQVSHLCGYRLLHRSGGLLNILRTHYPQHNWNNKMFQAQTKSQELLFQHLQTLFHGTEVEFRYNSSLLAFSKSTYNMELDVWVPKLNLCFEFQGKQANDLFGEVNAQCFKDEEKKKACTLSDLTLVCVPCWWDNKLSSLAATVHRLFPDFGREFSNALPFSERMLPFEYEKYSR